MRLVAILIGAMFAMSAFAQTQLDLNEDACTSYQKADAELNKTYKAILRKKSDDPVFLAAMKKAQRAWVAFRDAEIEAVYPEADKQAQYGSVYPMCNCGVAAHLTQQRVEQLKAWLTAEEGDVCNGSKWP